MTSGRPPRAATRLLRFVLPAADRDAVCGDLLEEFRRRDTGWRRAWYWREALAIAIRCGVRRRRSPISAEAHIMTIGKFDRLAQDLRYTLRSLAKTPTFSAIVIVTLALGIGASTAIFSAVNGILLRPLALPEPDRLLWINETGPEGSVISVSWPNFLDWRARARSFSGLAASRTNPFTWTGAEEARRIDGRRVTANFFDVLGVRMEAGRGFVESDDRPGAAGVAVVSHAFWRQQLHGDPGSLGRALTLDGRPFTIVGVLPDGFRYLRNYDVFTAMGPFAAERALTERVNHAGYIGLGRLRPGIGEDAAAREMTQISADLAREHPDSNSSVGVRVEQLGARVVSGVRQTLLVLFGAVGVLLLLACTNAANLLVARGAARRHELTIRAALGGSRLRLVAGLLVESLLVSTAGGLLGVLLASALLRLLAATAPEGTPRLDEVTLDWAALLFACAAVTASGVLFGAWPAFHATNLDSAEALTRTRTAGASARTHGVRRGLVVVEVGLALVLLAGAGLMVRSLVRLTTLDAGFRADHLLTLQVSMRNDRWDPARRAVMTNAMVSGIDKIPGVAGAAASSSLPIEGSDWNSVFVAEGQTPPTRERTPSAAFTLITPTYFETMGTRLVHGRAFNEFDRQDSARVVVVNESLAARIWPGESAIGKRLKQGWEESRTPWREVVGVVTDVKFEGLTAATPMQIYLPFVQDPPREVGLVIRTTIDPGSARAAVERLIRTVDRDLPVYSVQTMEQRLAASIARQRLAMLVLTVFAMVALTLAAIGLYGVMAHAVTERTHEIGVRMALGATRERVIRSIVAGGLRLTLAGTVAGACGAAALSRSLEGLLFGIQPTDPVTFSAVSAVLLLIGVGACYIPAWRAARIEPSVALRN
jgi:putative ABC transport system permease protein